MTTKLIAATDRIPSAVVFGFLPGLMIILSIAVRF